MQKTPPPPARTLIREDIEANRGNFRGTFIVVMFRIANRAREPIEGPPRFAAKPIGLIYMFVIEWLLGFELRWDTRVGRRLRVWHAYGTVISPRVVIGDDVLLRHGVTIGNNGRVDDIAPVIGNCVDIGAGAAILGDVHVGDGARIGANAVVLSDVPPGTTAVGNPARIIPVFP